MIFSLAKSMTSSLGCASGFRAGLTTASIRSENGLESASRSPTMRSGTPSMDSRWSLMKSLADHITVLMESEAVLAVGAQLGVLVATELARCRSGRRGASADRTCPLVTARPSSPQPRDPSSMSSIHAWK